MILKYAALHAAGTFDYRVRKNTEGVEDSKGR